MEFLLELARLRGTETLQNCVSPVDDKLQFLRFLAGSSESLARCISHAAASRSFYRGNCSEQWLLTVLTSQDTALKSESDLTIQSNVVPSRAYLTRLEGVRATCSGHQCTGGFVLTSDISPVLEGQLPYQSCTNCALAEQLRIRLKDHIAVDELANLLKLWFLEAKDVEPVRDIQGGTDGEVSIILWRDGTFARKRFHCDDDLLANPKFQNPKFNRELEVALQVSHPNIVHCFGCSSDCDLFMEVLDEDLESFLSRSEEMDPPFSLTDALEMLLQLAEAVKHLHENSFIHGDLKPGNILLSKLGIPHPDVPFYLVKVADFGCAQRFEFGAAAREDFDVKIGTYRYLAPEMKRCRKLRKEEDLREAVQNINPPKVDVFSFGVLANEVVANVQESDHLSSLQNFLLRCEAPEPEDRPYFAEICKTLSGGIKANDHGLRKEEGTCFLSVSMTF